MSRADTPANETSEIYIQHAILDLMKDGKVWTNAELKTKLSKSLPLTPADRAVGARKSEAVWENRVNNALGRARKSSLYGKGYVENYGHGQHKISSVGLAFINEEIDLDAILSDLLARCAVSAI